MKALAVKQPWASLICNGLKKVENRTWKTNYRGKLLIVASKTPDPVLRHFDELPAEWYDTILNNIYYGNLPELEHLPNSAVIGFADLVDCSDNEKDFPMDEIWYTGAVGWKLENICIFDEPQMRGIKSKLGLFDIEEIDENNLPPYHKAELRYPHFENDELVVPFTEDGLRSAIENNVLALYYYDDPLQIELTGELDGSDIKPCKTIRFETPKQIARFEVKELYIATSLDDNGEEVFVPSIFSKENVEDLLFRFELGKRLV